MKRKKRGWKKKKVRDGGGTLAIMGYKDINKESGCNNGKGGAKIGGDEVSTSQS